MIRNRNDLEAIKTKMIKELYLRKASMNYKVVFHYNTNVKKFGIDDLIDELIDTLHHENRFDVVVFKVYKEHDEDLLFVSIIEANKKTVYAASTTAKIKEVIHAHINNETLLSDYKVSEVGVSSL